MLPPTGCRLPPSPLPGIVGSAKIGESPQSATVAIRGWFRCASSSVRQSNDCSVTRLSRWLRAIRPSSIRSNASAETVRDANCGTGLIFVSTLKRTVRALRAFTAAPGSVRPGPVENHLA